MVFSWVNESIIHKQTVLMITVTFHKARSDFINTKQQSRLNTNCKNFIELNPHWRCVLSIIQFNMIDSCNYLAEILQYLLVAVFLHWSLMQYHQCIHLQIACYDVITFGGLHLKNWKFYCCLPESNPGFDWGYFIQTNPGPFTGLSSTLPTWPN